MGQYYNSVLKTKNGDLMAFYNYGLKLMEHSYFNNSYVNAVCEFLAEEAHYVAWIGDYADDDSKMASFRLHNANKAKQLDCDNGFTTFGMVLVNHSKREFLIMRDYYCKNFAAYVKDGHVDGWVIHPLPLLTCKGNGRGGGDYRGINQDQVGIWAEDLLEFIPLTHLEWNYQTKKYKVRGSEYEYKEVMFEFRERS